MRILQVHTRYRQAGGEDAVVEAERSALEAAGHEVVQHIEENPARPVGAAVSRRVTVEPEVGAAHRSGGRCHPS
jgi:hypothetical protein